MIHDTLMYRSVYISYQCSEVTSFVFTFIYLVVKISLQLGTIVRKQLSLISFAMCTFRWHSLNLHSTRVQLPAR